MFVAEYNDNSIDSLDGAERVRVRPAAVLGSDGREGARHGVTEILGNAIDEATAGFGDKLEIKYYKDGAISVRDFGRGVPMGYNDKKEKQNWFLVFNEMYAGGKYEDYQEELRAITDWSTFNPKDYNYLFSIGLNGLGAASTQYSSETFTAISIKQGVARQMDFRNGYPLLHIDGYGELHATPNNMKDFLQENPDFDIQQYEAKEYEIDEQDGTFIKWKPDSLVFQDVNIGFDWLRERAEALAYSSNVSVTLYNEELDETIQFDNGTVSDYVLINNRDNLLSDEPRIFETKSLTHGETPRKKIYICQAELAFVKTQSAGRLTCFHNAVKMKGGAQYEGIQRALADFFQTVGSEAGIKIVLADYEGKAGVVVNSFSNFASYKGQTKEEVDDDFIYQNVYGMLINLLRIERSKQNPEIIQLIKEVIETAEIRITIQQQTKALREVEKATKTRKLPEKFLPSKNFDEKKFDDSELWIVEGDSAKTSVKAARDSGFQAVYAIRGKMTNALKASLDKILSNKEIMEIITLAATGMEIAGVEDDSFDLAKSRFDKYVIGTDADEDGYQIRVLVFCMFWKLAPQIIENGMLYIAESPRFCFHLKDGSRLYAVTNEEKEAYAKDYAGQISRIERYKGLGQVNADILAETTLDPKTRRMTQIKLNPADYELQSVIETVFGKDPFKQRKQTLMGVLGSDVMDMFEASAEIMNLVDKGSYEEDEVEEYETA